MSHSLAEYWEIKKIWQKENEYLNCSLSCYKDFTAEKPNKLTKKKKRKEKKNTKSLYLKNSWWVVKLVYIYFWKIKLAKLGFNDKILMIKAS